MDRCALFVDASYALADGAMAVHGTRRRDSVSWNHAGLLTLLAGLAKDRTGLPVLRCYWYETALEGVRTPEQEALAEMPGLKLRLVNTRPGRREGIETPLRRDLVTLAKNGAISDAFIASADEHLAEIVTEVQDLGLRVVILHISADGSWTIPQPLRQECDDIVEISGVHLRPFVELIRGAEPTSANELRGQEAIGSRGSGVAGSLVGPLPGHGRALAAAPAQAALYPAAEYPSAEYPSADAQLLGDPVVMSAASAGPPAHSGFGAPAPGDHGASGIQSYVALAQIGPGQIGPGQVGPGQVGPGQPGHGYAVSGQAGPGHMTGGQAQAGPVQVGPVQAGSGQIGAAPVGQGQVGHASGGPAPAAGGPAQVGPVPLVPGYLNGAARGGAPLQQSMPGDGYLSGVHYGPAASGLSDLTPGSGQNGVTRNDYPGAPVHNGSSGYGGPSLNGRLPGRPDSGAATGYHAQPPLGYASDPGAGGIQAGGFQPAGAQPGGYQPTGSNGDGGRNGVGTYGSPGQVPAHQNGAVPPGAPQAGPAQSGVYQLGPVQHGAGYQNGAAQADPMQRPAQADPLQGPAQAGLAQAGPGQIGTGQPGPFGTGQPGPLGSQTASMYPAPVAPSLIRPANPPVAGAVFGPPGSYAAQPQPAALTPLRAAPPVSVPLPEAVQAAHAEGFSFGESVGRDAPGLWLDAVLARKPRMPSDLEARLLQGSALPIDSLLHDEVRHSLRRGFWDALEGARR